MVGGLLIASLLLNTYFLWRSHVGTGKWRPGQIIRRSDGSQCFDLDYDTFGKMLLQLLLQPEYISSICLEATVGGAKDDWQSVATAALKDSCEAGRQAAADVGAALEDFDGDSTWFVLLG